MKLGITGSVTPQSRDVRTSIYLSPLLRKEQMLLLIITVVGINRFNLFPIELNYVIERQPQQLKTLDLDDGR